jgi:GNAT superfamily N-acetyltransferase
MEDLGIRIGTPEDLDGCMELALMACRENGFVNPNPQKMLQDFWAALNMEQGLVALIGKEGEKIEGGILLRIGTMWYSDEPVLEEKAIFIHPDYRSARGGRARRLCEFSKQAAKSLGVPLIIGVLSNQRTEAKVRLYERQFGRPTGAFFLYNASTGMYQNAAE